MWRILLLLASLYSVSVFAQQPDPPEPGQGSDAETAQTVEIRSSALDSINASVEVIARNTAPAQEVKKDQAPWEDEANRISRADLEAQQSMANSTWWILVISAVGVVIGVVTIIFLGVNIYQTRSIIGLERAWITPFVGDPLVPTKIHPHPNLGTSVSFKWVNTGKTPALKVRYRMGKTKSRRIPIEEISRVSKIDMDQFVFEDWIVQGTVGCNQVFSHIYQFSSEALSSLSLPDFSVLIRMDIVYETVFSPKKKESGVVWEIRWDEKRHILRLLPVGHNITTT